MSNELNAAVVTLGCAKNTVDSENMLGLLRQAGFNILPVHSADEVLGQDGLRVDFCVVNTCGFIDAAKQESVNTILELASLKTSGRIGRLIVSGCLGQRYSGELLKEIPEIDAVIGTNEFPRIVETVRRSQEGCRFAEAVEIPYRYDEALPRLRLTESSTAYVKIAEGCDHKCAFCVIPQLRGSYRSRPMDLIVGEVRGLVADGVKEINLVSQDCTFYGRDLPGNRSLLPELLSRLNDIEGLKWIRLLYNYPMTFDDGIINAMASLPKVCQYIDIPLQHGSDSVLTGMKRGGRRPDLLDLVSRIRRRMPEVVFRSSFIVGFPGETEDDFQELLRFLTEIRFDYVGFFTYSREEGTTAARLSGQVPAKEKERRYHLGVEHQREISLERQSRHIGKTLEVIVEEAIGGASGNYRGRWSGQAPEVDGQVNFVVPKLGQTRDIAPIKPGDFVCVRITHADEYDLYGEFVNCSEESATSRVK